MTAGNISHTFRKEPHIEKKPRVKLGVRKEKTFSPENILDFRENDKRRVSVMSNNNNNQINIPQAREAMDRFKMQAAQDEDVSFTY